MPDTSGRLLCDSIYDISGTGKLRVKRGSLLNGYRVSVWKDEQVLEMNDSDGCTTL